MTELEDKIKLIEEFKRKLADWHVSRDAALRSWLNRNKPRVEGQANEAGCVRLVNVRPPEAKRGGIIRTNPFDKIFDPNYSYSVARHISDILNETIDVLQSTLPEEPRTRQTTSVTAKIQRAYAFVAMPMDEGNHALVDVLEAIKAGARECGITAGRIDDEESSERITDRMLKAIRTAEFVIVDLTEARPNVFYEAGYAEGIGKIPIYIARHGTDLHFDLQDYPVIFFKNLKELRDKLARRLKSIAKSKES